MLADLRLALVDALCELDKRQKTIDDLTRDCSDYRGRWMNEHRKNIVLSRMLYMPADCPERSLSLSQARPWDSSPTPAGQYFL